MTAAGSLLPINLKRRSGVPGRGLPRRRSPAFGVHGFLPHRYACAAETIGALSNIPLALARRMADFAEICGCFSISCLLRAKTPVSPQGRGRCFIQDGGIAPGVPYRSTRMAGFFAYSYRRGSSM